jgi:hypothetical protein
LTRSSSTVPFRRNNYPAGTTRTGVPQLDCDELNARMLMHQQIASGIPGNEGKRLTVEAVLAG